MPKFPKNTGFKMPGLGSKEKDTPGNFREEHHVDKIGYCDDTPINMLPPGSSPATFMGNEPLASPSDGSPLSYQWSLDDDPYTSVRYTPGALDVSDAFGDGDTPPIDSEENPGGINKTIVKEQITKRTPDKTVTTPGKRTGNTGKATNQAWFDKLTPAQLKEMGNPKNLGEAKTWVGDYWAKKNAKTTTTPGTTSTIYKVDGKVVDKATYDASGSLNKSKETK